MSGSRNALGPPMALEDYDPTDARFGSRYVLPRFNPPGTYIGALPTPPADYAAKAGELPPEYYHLLQNQGISGPDNPLMNQLLQLIYQRRRQRL